MKVLLTGATGYLGSHLLGRLIDGGHDIIILKRSFSTISRISGFLERCNTYDIDRSEIGQVFERHDIEVILHCATNYGRKDTDPLQTVDANLLLPLRLLELGHKAGVRTFLNTDTILDKGVNTYSLSKSQFKDWLRLKAAHMVCCNVALEHFFGPGDDESKFVSWIISSLLAKRPRLELTPGLQMRDFIFIDDVVDAMMVILTACQRLAPGFHSFEIGTGDSISVRHLVELIQDLTDNHTTELCFGAIPYRENEIMKCETNIDAVSKLGWKARYSLIQGLKKTIQCEMEGRIR